jgi:CRISPR/Cas system-associated exonuclease Cas4 (RecB family)
MVEYKIDAIPFAHDDLDTWRANFTGVQYLHEPTNLLIFGAVDDIWVNTKSELIVVDYKATAKKTEVSLDAPWQIAYKRQMEIYQWLLRQNGFEVNSTGYFVYTNGRLDLDGFFDRVEFRTKVIGYTGNDDWIEPVIFKIKDTLESDEIPEKGSDCQYCAYAESRVKLYESNRNKRVAASKK